MMKDRHGGDIWGLGAVVDFSSSINPLGPPPAARAAFRRSLGTVAAYPDIEARELKRALSLRHGLEERSLLPANGSTELIHLLPRVLRPKRALIVRPAFSEYESALGLAGVPFDGVTLGEDRSFALDVPLVAARLSAGRYDVVFLANPSNPAGALTKRDGVLELAGYCRRAGATLVVDEAFMDFSEGESVKAAAARLKNLIVLRSLTKFYALAGLRVGFAVSSARLIGELAGHLPPWSVNTPASASAAAAISDLSYAERSLRLIERERGYMEGRLSAIAGLKVFPSAANYLLLKLPPGRLDAARVKALMMKRGIIVRDLSRMAGLGRRFIRVSVRKREENAMFISGLKSILDR